ncbi:MAG TPA: SDR family oxidoreductase [Tepidisphaeraceae bacterium]|jgi:short-subunit dehydrogenase
MALSQPSPVRPTALVTGASGGIGYDLAKILAKNSHDVVLVARDLARLDAVALECRVFGAQALVIAKDLSIPSAPSEIYEQLRAAGVTIDVLVNNAGFGTHGPFATVPADADLGLLQVNIVALTHLTKLFLPPMLDRRRGRILNISSLAAFQPGPLMATYFASKAYVLYLSEAIAEEVAGQGVTVTALCPGPVRTGFRTRAGSEGKAIFGSAMEAGPVALAGFNGMMRGRRIVIPGLSGRLLVMLGRLAPRRWVTWAVGKMNRVH